MANFDVLFPVILKVEGGYCNDPDDAGGATNKGIIFSEFKAWRRAQGKPTPTIADLKALTDDEAKAIYKAKYWDRWLADEIHSQKVANIVVDWTINSGSHGITKPQALLGVKADGIVGAKTLAAINASNPDAFFEQVYNARVEFYNSIVARKPSQKKFLKGWLNRLKTIAKSC